MATTNEKIKFDKDELNKIKEFQQQYLNYQGAFGQFQMGRLRLEAQLDDIDKGYHQLVSDLQNTQKEELAFIDEVNTKYGDGVLDPTTGIFTPNISDKVAKST